MTQPETMQSASLIDRARNGLSGGAGTKVGRYLVVSVMNVLIHFSMLRLALWAWDWPGEWANAFAAAIAVVPAFLLSRYWVWEVKGRADVMAEIVPFWAIALVGLVVSSAMAGLGDRLSDDYRVVMLASFVGYFGVWVLKFVVLNALFGRSKARQAEERMPAEVDH